MDELRRKITLSVLDDVLEFDMFGAKPLTRKEPKDKVGCPSSQASPESDEMDEFLRALEAIVKTLSDLEAKKKNDLVDLNTRLLLRIEKVGQEKKEQMKYLTEIMQLMADLKKAYKSSIKRMQDKIFDLMKERDVRDMVDELNRVSLARKRSTNDLKNMARDDKQ